MKKKMYISFCSGIFLALFVVLGMNLTHKDFNESDNIKLNTLEEDFNKSDNIKLSTSQDIRTTYIAGLIRNLSIDDLIMESNLIVYGKLVDQSSPFKIKPVFGGDASIFSDYYIEPISVLRGSDLIIEGNNIPVRVQGGIIDDRAVEAEHESEFNIGDNYLLFLYAPNMGSGYNTTGEYYYVRGLSQGTFNQIDEKTFVSQYERIGSVDLDNLVAKINISSKSFPIHEDSFREQFKLNLESNLENGIISNDEYIRFKEEINEFATIID